MRAFRGKTSCRTAGVLTVASVAAVALSGCDSSQQQDVHTPGGVYRVELAPASFPEQQHLAQTSVFALAVRNAGDRALPNVAVTLAGKAGAPAAQAFAEASPQIDLDDPSRPVWIVNHGPLDGTTAHSNTWALGRLAPGATKTFRWNVTAMRAGDYTVSYRVDPDLDGKGRAVRADGGIPADKVKVHITRRAPIVTVTSDGSIRRTPPQQRAN